LTQPTLGGRSPSSNGLGTALFIRSQRGLTPTDAARDMARHAQAMSAASSAMMRTASGGVSDTRRHHPHHRERHRRRRSARCRAQRPGPTIADLRAIGWPTVDGRSRIACADAASHRPSRRRSIVTLGDVGDGPLRARSTSAPTMSLAVMRMMPAVSLTPPEAVRIIALEAADIACAWRAMSARRRSA